ncbi:MAG: peptide methionine sulfoxide reductase msrA/msrB [Candidatus Paceibacteria bacterium]|jgi:peptide methionine sulfoxide reductase msrA/msrB
MGFINSILVSIAAFFGFGQPDMPAPVEIVPIMQEEQQIEVESLAIDSKADVTDEMPVGEPIASLSPEADVVDLPEVEKAEDIMTGSGSPVSIQSAVNIQTMLVAGGCFWCVESDLEKLPGVIEVVSGYSGGSSQKPTYQDYGSGGHREVVEVTYDANQVSFEDVLIVTMKTTDPTDDDGTFADRGDKYSSAFYYENDAQKQIIDNLITEVDDKGPYDKPLAIDVEKRATFWRAEDFHQDYYKGTLSKLKYQYYRTASGRDAFIKKYWGANDHSTALPWRTKATTNSNQTYMWSNYKKPTADELKEEIDELTYRVTQNDGTEKAGSSPLDKIYEPGIYVDVLSGEPLYSSKDKFDSGTGWPSFVRPITDGAIIEKEDKGLFSTRTEIRSVIADNHIGHVFSDGPKDSTGLRYCMNGVALKFIAKADMQTGGYGDFLQYVD